jgi:plastocyanin
MKRREFAEKFGVGAIAVASAGVLASVASLTGRKAAAAEEHHAQSDVNQDGPLASVTISFGSWMLPLDRFPNNSPRTANHHKVLPYTSTIKAGGAVTFNISGTHHILVYAPGTTLESISRTIIEATAGPPPFPGFIDDPVNRVYRGLDPRPLPQDRQESITLADKGTYLVVCGLVPHFDEGMHGWVKVV